MIYKPKTLYNPTRETIEFRRAGALYIFKPGEKKFVEGVIAHHALTLVNTGLVEYVGQDSAPGVGTAYSDMPWRQLISLAAKEGIKTVGKKREEIEALLAEIDADKEGALQEPASQEETAGA